MRAPAQSRRSAAGLGLSVGILTLVLVGLPIALVPHPRSGRLTSTLSQDDVVLTLMVVLAAAFGAAFALPTNNLRRPRLAALAGSLVAFVGALNLALLAISCPTWNGAIARLLGERGALTVLQPLQPVLILGALLLLGLTLALRLQPVPRGAGVLARAVPLTQRHARVPGLAVRGARWMLPTAALATVGLLLVLRPATPARTIQVAPDFTLPAATNRHGSLSLRRLRGHAVLLNFFNSQCPPCIAEMPTLRQAARDYQAQGVVVLGVATGGDTVTTARQFAHAQHIAFPVVADERQDVAWRYLVTGWPTSFFLDAQGRMRGRANGPLDPQMVRNGLAQARAIRCDRCGPVRSLSVGTIFVGTAAPTAADIKLNTDVVFTPPRAASPFALRDQRGVLITPNHLRGRIVALTYISAACRSQCPLVGEALGQVRRYLGAAGARLSIVAISVDPERDSARTTRQFAIRAGWHGTDWHYLTASRAVLARVWLAYNELVGTPPTARQDPQHLTGLYLIDPRGRLRAYDNAPFLAPRVAATMRLLLATRA